MPPRPLPGYAFALPLDSGFAVGLVTHDRPKIGSLVWIAEPTFVYSPSTEDVEVISDWRWPVFFPLAAAIRRQLVGKIGVVTVPERLRHFPQMRAGNRQAGWTVFIEDEDGNRSQLGPANSPDLPIYQVVNETQLREMIAQNWMSRDAW